MPHIPAPFPPSEDERALSLEHLGVLDSAPEKEFDDIVMIASTLCDVPVSLVSLVDRERQWFKACVGLDVRETHRDLAFCAHAILAPADVLIVEDAKLDSRFQNSALVLGPPHIRFYAGAPIIDDTGHALGTVCVIDTKPRKLTEQQRTALLALARQTSSLLQLRLLRHQREYRAEILEKELAQAKVLNQLTEESLHHARRISSLGMVTASIAHDFNNILQALSASLQMIRLRARRPGDVEQFSDTGLQAVDQGRHLVSHLLSSVRLDSPNLVCLEVNARLEEMRDLLLRTATESIDLAFDLSAPNTVVMCEEAQLNAAVLNLLTNARDALGAAGRICISTRLVCVEGDVALAGGNYIVLSVTDTGPGIPVDLAAKIFEPFFTTKERGKGTGLGLSQVREFAENAGGTVRVNTAPDKGTTVSLYLKALGRIDSVIDPT
ncbi:GAF domain-containing protein [Pseudomonas sp. P7]|uniref:sensor histidine kinase n=1 Tax=Pseudomonas TaxID=286 RepID=UPI0015EC21D1|nr:MULTISPECIES: ATP-binding protein [Pseudomonas]MBA2922841.1 GAF domain-containing protein [Pseudomonas sivasensis]MBP5950054.1 GAF domain-containing protein [Pseudomonas sp. P42]